MDWIIDLLIIIKMLFGSSDKFKEDSFKNFGMDSIKSVSNHSQLSGFNTEFNDFLETNKQLLAQDFKLGRTIDYENPKVTKPIKKLMFTTNLSHSKLLNLNEQGPFDNKS